MLFWAVMGILICGIIHQALGLLWIRYWSVRIDREVFEPWDRTLATINTLLSTDVEGWQRADSDIQNHRDRLDAYRGLRDSMNPLVWYRMWVGR